MTFHRAGFLSRDEPTANGFAPTSTIVAGSFSLAADRPYRSAVLGRGVSPSYLELFWKYPRQTSRPMPRIRPPRTLTLAPCCQGVAAIATRTREPRLPAVNVYAGVPARRRAAACCSRKASVNTNNPAMLSFCSSSTRPRWRRPSMSAAFWFRTEPPPNNLISRRCSDLVNSSQGIVGILMLPVIQDRRLPHKAARRDLDCLRHEHLPHSSRKHLFCL
jgi:hypothetical protein